MKGIMEDCAKKSTLKILRGSNEMRTLECVAVNKRCASWRPVETDETVGWRVGHCEGVCPTPTCLNLAQHNPSFHAAPGLCWKFHRYSHFV